MTTAQPINIPQGGVRSIYRNTCPTPIAPVNTVSILWTNVNGGVASFNFQSVVPAVIGGIQGCFVDNSSCVFPVTITDTIGNQFTVPAGWQGFIPIAYTNGGTVLCSIPYAIQQIMSVDAQAEAMTTNLEFYNEEVRNVTMWPASEPAGVATSGQAYWPLAVSGATFDTSIECGLAYNSQTIAAFQSNPASGSGAPLLIEEILGGGIFPTTNAEQGSTGFYGAAVLYDCYVANATEVPSGFQSGGLHIPINYLPSAPVQAIAVQPTKFRLIYDPNNELGAGAVNIYAIGTDGGGDSANFPAVKLLLNVRARVLA